MEANLSAMIVCTYQQGSRHKQKSTGASMLFWNKLDWLSMKDSHKRCTYKVLISILIASYPMKAGCTNTWNTEHFHNFLIKQAFHSGTCVLQKEPYNDFPSCAKVLHMMMYRKITFLLAVHSRRFNVCTHWSASRQTHRYANVFSLHSCIRYGRKSYADSLKCNKCSLQSIAFFLCYSQHKGGIKNRQLVTVWPHQA